MAKSFKKGDRVRWNTPQGATDGTIVGKETGSVKLGRTELKGSKDDPVYIVESESSGKRAGHKAGALRKRS
jgi:hypothetical protein